LVYLAGTSLLDRSCLFATEFVHIGTYALLTQLGITGNPSTNNLESWREDAGVFKFFPGKRFWQSRPLVSRVPRELFIEDQTSYCGRSPGAISATEYEPLGSPQKRCPIIVKVAEVVGHVVLNIVPHYRICTINVNIHAATRIWRMAGIWVVTTRGRSRRMSMNANANKGSTVWAEKRPFPNCSPRLRVREGDRPFVSHHESEVGGGGPR